MSRVGSVSQGSGQSLRGQDQSLRGRGGCLRGSDWIQTLSKGVHDLLGTSFDLKFVVISESTRFSWKYMQYEI